MIIFSFMKWNDICWCAFDWVNIRSQSSHQVEKEYCGDFKILCCNAIIIIKAFSNHKIRWIEHSAWWYQHDGKTTDTGYSKIILFDNLKMQMFRSKRKHSKECGILHRYIYARQTWFMINGTYMKEESRFREQLQFVWCDRCYRVIVLGLRQLHTIQFLLTYVFYSAGILTFGWE